MAVTAKRKVGFAALKERDPARLLEIATQGGKSVPAEKRSFSIDRELAVAAGSIGGKSVSAEKRSFNNREVARAAGKKGGAVRAKQLRKK